MSFRDDSRERDSIFSRVREKHNPNWREQHKRHLKQLFIGPETKGMGAREIINRALKLKGVEVKKKRFRPKL